MNSVRRCLLLLLILCSSCHAERRSEKQSQGSAMPAFVDDYFDALFEWNPTTATFIGFHQYDSKIEDFSRASVQRRIEKLKQLQSALESARSDKLTADEEIDAEILDGQIKAELLDLETLETWRRNPMNYVGLPGNSID